ncbi:MAG: hypothetical protein EB090_06935, partial [Verrucomicrobia bacterium]|nr:hypothetical protein [Verrucomicrobiota bacterium]
KPGVQLRASCYLATGKYPFVRLEQEIQLLPNGEVKVIKNTEMVGDQIIVKLPQGSPATDIQTLAAKIGGQAAAKPFTTDTWLISLPQKLEAVPEALAASMNSGIPIDYAEPNHLVRPLRTPNDPNFTNNTQWSLYNNTQLNIDIHAPQVWDRRFNGFYTTNGATNTVVVAVIDTGVRYTHEDLAANMWKNPGETGTDSLGRNKETNGVDDDGNNYIDDVHGIDTYDNDSDPMPGAAHGTHCAGLIAAVGNNGKGITGVAWSGVQIMALKMFGPNGESPTAISDITACVNYAANKGAKVINASYGSTSANNTEAGSIYQAGQAGVIMVAAAGNGGSDFIGDNNDSTPFYPACYTSYNSPKPVQITNIVAVGSTDRNDNRSTFSNYGATSVDLFAPGENMYSTESASDSNYNSGSGTSFAAPLVTGAVALLASEFPGDSVGQRMARITGTNAVDVVPGLNGYCKTGGRLNLAKLLPAADPSTLPLAVAWHRPDYTEPLLGSAMRTPTNAAIS